MGFKHQVKPQLKQNEIDRKAKIEKIHSIHNDKPKHINGNQTIFISQ